MTPDCGSAPPPPEAADVRLELARILASAAFRGSRRCQDFLVFVVGQALAGDPESLKERTLAVNVFGRAPDANLNEDSIVRVGAREVRKRLAQYYAGEGFGGSVRIELPAGTYVPAFQRSPPAKVVEPEPLPALSPPAETARGRPLWVPVASVLLLACVVLLAWQWTHRTPREFDTFWRPMFDDPEPVSVILPASENLSPAVFALGGLFAGHRSRLDLTDGGAAPKGPAVRLGASALPVFAGLRFRLDPGAGPAIVDTRTGARWSGAGTYLLCRLRPSTTRGLTVAAAGVGPSETAEAARVLSDPAALDALLRGVPAGWTSRNFEIVVLSKPQLPEIMATHVW